MDRERLKEYFRLNPNGISEEEMAKIEQEMAHPKEKTISDVYLDFKLWCRGLPSRQEAFADFVEANVPKGSRVLEVGGGKRGSVSRLLAERGYEMTCMDPKLEALSDAKVCMRRQEFDYREVSLDGFDWVVAQEPCEAAEHVIRGCLAQNVPFLVALCGSPHRLISGETPEDVWEWYRYLSQIDPERTKTEIVKVYTLAGVVVIRG